MIGHLRIKECFDVMNPFQTSAAQVSLDPFGRKHGNIYSLVQPWLQHNYNFLQKKGTDQEVTASLKNIFCKYSTNRKHFC